MFHCPSCGVSYPRDYGGSSGVFLRHLTMLHLDQMETTKNNTSSNQHPLTTENVLQIEDDASFKQRKNDGTSSDFAYCPPYVSSSSSSSSSPSLSVSPPSALSVSTSAASTNEACAMELC
jgi:hypothetical protein